MLWVILLRAALSASIIGVMIVLCGGEIRNFEILILFLTALTVLGISVKKDGHMEEIICSLLAVALSLLVNYFVIKMTLPEFFIVFGLFTIILRLGTKEFKELQNNP